jgi:hypothetical protein
MTSASSASRSVRCSFSDAEIPAARSSSTNEKNIEVPLTERGEHRQQRKVARQKPTGPEAD